MDLSIIIVNYNVKALLEQTLLSVYKAIHNLQIEIIVVDNNSADESCAMVSDKSVRPSAVRHHNPHAAAEATSCVAQP